MRTYATFVVRSLQSQPLGAAAAAAAMTTASMAYADISKINWAFSEPGWINNRSFQILIVAVGVLAVAFAYVLSRQATQEKNDSEHIRRLRLQPYSTFGEIALAITNSSSAYSKQEILDRLMKAAIASEFSERTGHSRMRIAPFDAQSTPIQERPIIKLSDVTDLRNLLRGDKWLPGYFIYMAMLLRAPSRRGDIDPIHFLTLERADFLRWHRRFRNGRYEH